MILRQLVLARPPAYRPVSYRPLLSRIAEPRGSLGQSIPSSIDSISAGLKNVVQSVGIGAIGACAMYASGILPDPVKELAMIGGVGLIGYGVYSLFTGGTPPVPPPTTENPYVTPGSEVPNLPVHQMQQKISIVINPDQPMTGGKVARSSHIGTNWGYDYTVENYLPKPIEFFAGIAVYEADSTRPLWVTPTSAPGGNHREPQRVPAATKLSNGLTMPGKASFNLKVDGLPIWWAESVGVEIQLFESRDAALPFLTSASIPVTYMFGG